MAESADDNRTVAGSSPAVSTSFLLCSKAVRDAVSLAENKMLTQYALECAYREFNRKYFFNRLPDDCELVIVNKRTRTMGKQLGDNITLNSRYREDHDWIMTLLHEMCHLHLEIKNNKKHNRHPHGKEFDREMIRIAKLGAFHNLW